MIVWHSFETEKPPIGVLVIAYHHKWINEDFNPIGQRVGFVNEDGDFTSVQDDYIGLAHWKCDDGDEFDHDSDNIKYIDPEYWTEMPNYNATLIKKVSK